MIQSRLPSVGQCRSVDRVGAGQTDTWQLLGFRGTIHSLTVVTLNPRLRLRLAAELDKERNGTAKNSIEKNQSRISVNWVIKRAFLFCLSNVLVFIKLTDPLC